MLVSTKESSMVRASWTAGLRLKIQQTFPLGFDKSASRYSSLQPEKTPYRSPQKKQRQSLNMSKQSIQNSYLRLFLEPYHPRRQI